MQHPTSELIAYLSGELAPADRERVDAHLAGCAECRRARDAFREILDGLRASAPAPPEVHWGRWRAELRAKVEARGRRRRWWLSPVPVALSAALAGVLLVFAWQGGVRHAPRPDLPSVEEVAVEQLDLLEDLELIGHLDRLAPQQEG
jgi:anti-sigma factor RsiW